MTAHAHPRLRVEDVKAAVMGDRFLDLVVELGGRFRRRQGARSVRMPCFLHAGVDPNLVVTPATGLWHCMSSCGGGDQLELVERARGIDFAAALAWLAEWARLGVSRPSLEIAPRPRKVTPVDTSPLMSELWALVERTSFGHDALAWLASRSVEPDAAYALGCRDWTTRRAEIGRLLKSTPDPVLEAAGFGRGATWRPVQALLAGPRGVVSGPEGTSPASAWSGLAVPAWPLDAAHPTRWRWRLYDAPTGEAKSRSPIGGDADLLGFVRPPAPRGCSIALPPTGVDTLLIVEGEPDWLSATEACDGRALVVAVCGGANEWRESWPAFGDIADLGIRRVAVCVHQGRKMAACRACGRSIHADCDRCRFCAASNDATRTDGVGHGETFAADIAEHARMAGLSCRRRLPAEAYDLNDRHRAGALRAWLAEVLA